MKYYFLKTLIWNCIPLLNIRGLLEISGWNIDTKYDNIKKCHNNMLNFLELFYFKLLFKLVFLKFWGFLYGLKYVIYMKCICSTLTLTFIVICWIFLNYLTDYWFLLVIIYFAHYIQAIICFLIPCLFIYWTFIIEHNILGLHECVLKV